MKKIIKTTKNLNKMKMAANQSLGKLIIAKLQTKRNNKNITKKKKKFHEISFNKSSCEH